MTGKELYNFGYDESADDHFHFIKWEFQRPDVRKYFSKAAEGLDKQDNWISVEDEMPQNDDKVLTITVGGWYYVAMYNCDCNQYDAFWEADDNILQPDEVKYWQPLPKAREEK